MDSSPRFAPLTHLSRSRTASSHVMASRRTTRAWSSHAISASPPPGPDQHTRTGDQGHNEEVAMVMDPKRAQLEHEYRTALRDCVAGAGEEALAHAYELGRVAA